MASIRVESLCKRYGTVEAVRDLTLTCADGELLALLGPSGCGKTSTLKMLAGVEAASSGEVYFGDRSVTRLDAARRNVAMVFEDYALYPHLTVAQNIAFPLEIRRAPSDEIARAVDGALALLGLERLRDVGVRQLSGGAQQRVAIGRALVRQPAVILFDEPLSHLDGAHKLQLRAEIKRLQKTAGVTGVLVTHDQIEAMAMADRIAVMNGGVLQQVGGPQELYDHPANLFVAQFIGEPPMNLLPGSVIADGGRLTVAGPGFALELPPPAARRLERAPRPPEVVVGVRSEDLALAAPGGAAFLSGTVFFRERRGETDIALVRPALGGRAGAPPDLVAVEIPAGSPAAEDDRVAVALAGPTVHLFDAATGVNLLEPSRAAA